MKYNIWNKWDPLRVCMLGNNYAPEFFNGVNKNVADPLKKICEETLEDLEKFKEILQDFGVEVIQPDMDSHERFIDNPSWPRGPLQPRDYQLVLGNKLYSYDDDHSAIYKKLKEYSEVSTINFSYPSINKKTWDIVVGPDYPSWEYFQENFKDQTKFEAWLWDELLELSRYSWLSSACCFMIGKKLYIGTDAEFIEPAILSDDFDKFEVKFLSVDGHVDGNFHPIKPGAILSLNDVQTYSETFPGWDVCYLPDQSWNKVKPFLNLKEKNKGKWWVAGEEDNDEFTHFVETWLQDWVGYVEETVFDVNVLMLDENHCCVSNLKNEKVNAFLKKHEIEPVYVPWRHRYFWDGGLHCITLDLYREGEQKDYFK